MKINNLLEIHSVGSLKRRPNPEGERQQVFEKGRYVCCSCLKTPGVVEKTADEIPLAPWISCFAAMNFERSMSSFFIALIAEVCGAEEEAIAGTGERERVSERAGNTNPTQKRHEISTIYSSDKESLKEGDLSPHLSSASLSKTTALKVSRDLKTFGLGPFLSIHPSVRDARSQRELQ
ncbi:hypothetical protein FNV43_RR12043 [Rhamnella rubrinervis]|uniref:Uncharacterized protein n=1 Tax=Rhamnella rubrinervis TaxID=2594499 RepID=A0A8K0H7L5_9ROSA|nr:hypothetical protein FNV43_RR12043 [Rhamnella rubrinervis]